MSQEPIYEVNCPAGGMWSKVISRGKVLRITDVEGGLNLSALFYNADDRTERYNMPDTLKGQQIFFLTHPFCLHTDMGRIIASMVTDTCGWHETVCGTTTAEMIQEKYGEKTYQDARNDFYRNGQDGFMTELSKWGLGRRDVVPNVNFFSKVVAADEGELTYMPGNSVAGDYVELRFEMNTLVVLVSTQHPLDPGESYAPKPFSLSVFVPDPADADGDACRNSKPENQWAFTNTDDYNRLRFSTA
ncbi:MAG: urea amidolyase associated protein UAAP1 [Verrucomicrobiota bacterium]